MQLSLRALIPIALFAFAHASPHDARDAPSAIAVPIADGSSALAQAKPADTTAAGVGSTTDARPHNLTANAAQTDPAASLYVCSDVNCGGTCEYFPLNSYAAKTCIRAVNFPFASGYIEDGNIALSYQVGEHSTAFPPLALIFLPL
jgi:hypothetical protein